MNWEKFTWLVSEQRLWMTWLPMLEDKYEGKTPIIVSKEFQQALSSATNDADRAVINGNIDIMRSYGDIDIALEHEDRAGGEDGDDGEHDHDLDQREAARDAESWVMVGGLDFHDVFEV